MATRDELIRELEQEIAQLQPGAGGSMTTEEMDWMRSAKLAVERLQSAASSEDDEQTARGVLDRIRNSEHP